jgi:hypothetical protein
MPNVTLLTAPHDWHPMLTLTLRPTQKTVEY